jgi:predicted nucleotidyltransferase
MGSIHIPESLAAGYLPVIRGHQSELEQLCSHFHVRRLELFGSAVGGGFNSELSDLDFLVEFDSLPAGAYADTFFGFKQALEGLFGLPVDLVIPSAIRNPYFRQSIDKCKALLYAA